MTALETSLPNTTLRLGKIQDYKYLLDCIVACQRRRKKTVGPLLLL